MKLTELLEQMQLKILSRHIGFPELPDDVCVLMGTWGDPAEEHIRVLSPEALEQQLKKESRTRRCLFCAGQPEKMPPVPENCDVICFRAEAEEIAMAAQRGVYALRRRAELFPGRESLLGRLLEGQVQGDANSEELLRGLGLKPQCRFCLVLVSFLGRVEEIPWDDAARQLSRILDHCPVSEYRGDLLALCSVDPEEITLRLPERQMEEFLSRQGGYAVVSTSAMRPTAVRALYQQARAVMRFGLALGKEENSRVFRYEKYAFYHIVELCADAYREDFQIHNLVYLCHPSLGRVLRYDRSHKTNYTEILRKYLENNCNLSQTAREMFMHRNTMLNKLETIRELLGVSLTDPAVREQLQFSFHVVDYAEKILQGRTF